MTLKHILIAVAAAISLPTLANAGPATGGRTVEEVRAEARGLTPFGEAGVPFDFITKSTLTREEVRAQARGLKSIGEADFEFDFNTKSMLTREEVRAQLMAHRPAEYTGA